MNIQIQNTNIQLKPRFYVVISVFFIITGVLGFMFFPKNKNSNMHTNPTVLAANTKNDLLETKDEETSTQAVAIEDYQPVTIAYTVKEGDTLQSIAEKYHADAQTIADFPNNGLQESLQLTPGQVLIIPNGYTDDSQKPVLPPIAQGTGQFLWPVRGVITQYAFYWHPGAIDIAAPLLTEVHAADDGTVETVEHLTTGYGVHVIIDHGDGLTSLYGHLTETRVVEGQGIRKGDLLGLSGSTGHSTGPHLHFEVRRHNVPVDPMTLLPPQ